MRSLLLRSRIAENTGLYLTGTPYKERSQKLLYLKPAIPLLIQSLSLLDH